MANPSLQKQNANLGRPSHLEKQSLIWLSVGWPASLMQQMFGMGRAAVVLLPEERHARGAEKTEKFEQFGGALAFITGEKNSAKVKNDVFHRDKDTKKSNGAQHKIARNSVKPSDW